jgi:vacuolar fusion protein MON1
MIRSDPSILLGALEVAKLRKTTRDKINIALLSARHDDLLYGMIVAEGRLVTVIRPRRHSLHPSDMQLLFSMVFNSNSLCNGNEHWIPLCLPKFNAKGFLHAYIWAQNSVAVILISADKNAFFHMRTVKEKVIDELEKSGIWNKIQSIVHRGRYTLCIYSYSETNEADIGISGIIHFLYKSKVQVQFTMPALPSNEHMTRHLLALYRHLHAVVHTRKTHIKIFHYLSRRFSALVWVGTGFECYVVAEGKIGRSMLAKSARAIVRWVRTEEARVFVSGGVVF